MITRIFRWPGIVLGSLLVVAATSLGLLNAQASARLTKKYEVPPESLIIPTDQESMERGKKLNP